jgi:hypothetical protein
MTQHASTDRTSVLLDRVANSDREDEVLVDELLHHFSQRAFGAMLLVAILPALLPVPFGVGAVSGVLVTVLGLQMLILLPYPWLPGFVRRRGISRARFIRFNQRLRPMLTRFERVSRPRMEALAEHPAANAFTGLLLVLVGVLLSLPIPLTNYPFGLLVLAFALALIERDGALLLVAWTIASIASIATALLSREVIDLIGKLFG